MEFRLPSTLGEGIDAITVTKVLVKVGDTVKAGQNVLSAETDKASVEIPVESAGTVQQIHVKQGDKIPIGGLILTLSGSATPAAPAPAPAAPAAAASPPPPPAPAATLVEKVEFKLPNLGEGIDAATVIKVMVKPGDTVTSGQNVASVETDKASVDVPIEMAGTVEEVRVRTGDKIPIGAVLFIVTGNVAAPATTATAAPAKAAAPSPALVPAKPIPASTAVKPAAPANGSHTNGNNRVVAAGPATRRLARELGVNLGEVTGTARGNRVTLDDVKGFVRNRMEGKSAGGNFPGLSGKTVADSFAVPPLPDFAKFGEVERKPASGIRKKIAENLTIAWRVMPMVTQHDLADITDLEAGRKRIVDGLPKGSPKVTMTVLAVKAVVAALKEFPNFNSSYDMNSGELILKKYFHIGIAVDTPRGLVVPVIRDADKKSIRDIAAEVTGLADKAKAGTLTMDEMRGGSFTITNLGGIGGTAFTPIVNYPEVAILGLSRSAMQPVVRDCQIIARLMMPLSLTYDHRVIDGADGARFTTRLSQLFGDPIRLLMES